MSLELCNYYPVRADRLLAETNKRLKEIDNVIMPFAKECLQVEKNISSQHLYKKYTHGWRWKLWLKWFYTRDALRDWAMANPGYDESMFFLFHMLIYYS